MDPQPATASEPAGAAPTAAAEAARVRIERNLEVLDLLREAALDYALAIKRQAVEPEAPKVVEGDVALAFSRAARAARLSVALQQRLIEEQQRPGSSAEATQTHLKVSFVDGPTGELRDNPRDARAFMMPSAEEKAAFRADKVQALGVVRKVAAAALLPGELSPRDEAEAVDRAEREAAERFESETEDDFVRLMRRPFSEIVAHICRDIGLTPDWEVLAGEAWALEEIAGERVGAPLRPFAPPDGGGGDAEPSPPRPMPPPEPGPRPGPS